MENDRLCEKTITHYCVLTIHTARTIDFISTYFTLGAGIAAFGGPDWTVEVPGKADGKFGAGLQRDKKKGSPVVPGSHVRVLAEGDYVMFSIAVLKGHTEAGKYEGETFVPGMYCHVMLCYVMLCHTM